jgi:hypothetical protein
LVELRVGKIYNVAGQGFMRLEEPVKFTPGPGVQPCRCGGDHSPGIPMRPPGGGPRYWAGHKQLMTATKAGMTQTISDLEARGLGIPELHEWIKEL